MTAPTPAPARTLVAVDGQLDGVPAHGSPLSAHPVSAPTAPPMSAPFTQSGVPGF